MNLKWSFDKAACQFVYVSSFASTCNLTCWLTINSVTKTRHFYLVFHSSKQKITKIRSEICKKLAATQFLFLQYVVFAMRRAWFSKDFWTEEMWFGPSSCAPSLLPYLEFCCSISWLNSLGRNQTKNWIMGYYQKIKGKKCWLQQVQIPYQVKSHTHTIRWILWNLGFHFEFHEMKREFCE